MWELDDLHLQIAFGFARHVLLYVASRAFCVTSPSAADMWAIMLSLLHTNFPAALWQLPLHMVLQILRFVHSSSWQHCCAGTLPYGAHGMLS
jgi:hypothetical protein